MKKEYLFWKSTLPIVFFLFVFCAFDVSAQNKVSGKVKDETGMPIPGVTIKVEGANKGTSSDLDGSFVIDAKNGETLTFSFIGFRTIKREADSSKPLNIQMSSDTKVLDEVVIVGYGTQKKKELTGAVSTVKADLIAKSPVSDFGEAIQGQVAGVNVQAASGRPGEAANIQIRGVGSLIGTLEPLYVLDGIPQQSNPNISPDQIESLDILKDGAAASVYGTRASNGVIIITTKRGKKGQMVVDLNTYTGIQNITSGTPLMNTQQQLFADYTTKSMLSNSLPTYFITGPNLLDYDSDFVGDVQNNNALIRNYGLSISGGSENLTLNLNSNYFDQEGVLINSGFSRFSNRLNGQFTKGKFKAFASLALSSEERTQEPWSLYEYSVGQTPWSVPLSDIDSSNGAAVVPVDNVIYYGYLARELQNEDKRESKTSSIAVNLEYEILKGLKLKANLGNNNYDYQRKFFRPQVLLFDRDGKYNATASRPDAMLNEEYTFSERNTIEGILNYNVKLNKHSIDLTGVLSREEFNSKQVGVGVIGLLSNDTQTLGSGKAATTPTSYDYSNSLTGKMARLQYNYDGRYLFSASYRVDGSSNFGSDNRYGKFPGVSAGWNLSEESFFKDSSIKNVIDNLKFRGSYAEVGNQSIPAYTYSNQIEPGVNYLFGADQALNSGAIQRRFANPNVKWETSISTDLGFDLAMFTNRLNLTVDVYKNDKKDMLLPQQTPASGGSYVTNGVSIYSPIIVNAGNMTNKGLEIALSYKDQLSNGLNYTVSGTFTKNVNEVTSLDGITRGYGNGRPTQSLGDEVNFTTFFAEGYEAGAFFLLQSTGVLKSQAEADAYNIAIPGSAAKPGDMSYADINGDHVINDDDRVYAGSGQADFEAGLNFNIDYKNFDLGIQNYFSSGAKIYNGSRYYAYTQGRHADQFNMWSPQNPTSDVPSDRDNFRHNNVRAASDYFLEDGTYFRIRNITLGYTLPKSILEKIGLSTLRLYLTGMNPFTFTNYNGYDPEVGGNGISTRGVDSGNYPVTRKFVFGAQVKF
jgi:TonB-dependent starch-binding outer membrane protein SusC